MKVNQQHGILYGLAIWLVTFIFFKVLLNSILLITTFCFISLEAFKRRSWRYFNLTIGSILYRDGLLWDVQASIYGGPLLNKVFLKNPNHRPVNKVPIQYGGTETISYYTGINAIIGNLNKHGGRFRSILAKVLGVDHSIESVPNYIKKLLKK